MQLNISLSSAPVVEVTQKGFVATIFSDITIEVLDSDKAIPVACISVDFTVSGDVNISGNKLGVMRVFLNTVVMPYVNIYLGKGFSIPVFHGLTLQNAQLVTTSSKIILCSDLTYINSSIITGYAS
ncbi:hypothetical protein IEQ34_010125 [Dendrobium chrysotoxum]|uniref:Lipid-binding serum glycoprotein C-terminal domain-containing protein n=1 Tax=Dendrobium chrysotoxum TaxID=161865 RepID=A0AAV7H2T2_DENCH|nr:hypothetical protein IEQ34_010125 [Dendrobium chrysotoxum]